MPSVGTEDYFVLKLSQCSSLSLSAVSNTINCPNDTNGSATISVSGVGPCLYSWNPYGGNSNVANGLSAGIFTCSVINTTCGAEATLTVNVLSEFPNPSVSISASPSLICSGQTTTLNATGAISYLWNNGNANPSISISPTVTSSYTVIGINPSGCYDFETITVIVSICTDISKLLNVPKIRIFPNPANEILFVGLDSMGEETALVQVVNTMGQCVLEKTCLEGRTDIDISNLPSGINFVKVSSQNRQQTFKLLKE